MYSSGISTAGGENITCAAFRNSYRSLNIKITNTRERICRYRNGSRTDNRWLGFIFDRYRMSKMQLSWSPALSVKVYCNVDAPSGNVVPWEKISETTEPTDSTDTVDPTQLSENVAVVQETRAAHVLKSIRRTIFCGHVIMGGSRSTTSTMKQTAIIH